MHTPGSLAGIGVDIVELARVRAMRFPARFAEYFLTAPEMESLRAAPDPAAFIASRFAAKEAVIKAFPGLMKPHWFEIAKEGVKPVVRFVSPGFAEQYRAMVALSHSTEYAAGFVAIERL